MFIYTANLFGAIIAVFYLEKMNCYFQTFWWRFDCFHNSSESIDDLTVSVGISVLFPVAASENSVPRYFGLGIGFSSSSSPSMSFRSYTGYSFFSYSIKLGSSSFLSFISFAISIVVMSTKL